MAEIQHEHHPKLQHHFYSMAQQLEASILGLGYLLAMTYLIYSIFKGAPAPANPWGAKGLEWTTTSPPPTFNFDEDVVVTEPAYHYVKTGQGVHHG